MTPVITRRGSPVLDLGDETRENIQEFALPFQGHRRERRLCGIHGFGETIEDLALCTAGSFNQVSDPFQGRSRGFNQAAQDRGHAFAVRPREPSQGGVRLISERDGHPRP